MMRLAKYEHLMLTGVFSVDDGDKQRITNNFNVNTQGTVFGTNLEYSFSFLRN